MRSTTARDASSSSGRRPRWLPRWAETWFSVSTTKPRLAASLNLAAIVPMAKAPANHSGFSSEGLPPRACRRSRVHARWSISSRAACSRCSRSSMSLVTMAWALYRAWAHTSPTWLTRIKAAESLRCSSLKSASAIPAAGERSEATGSANRVRRAASAAVRNLSMVKRAQCGARVASMHIRYTRVIHPQLALGQC